MPMLCKRCGFSHETAAKCHKCGGEMHYSLLSGTPQEEESTTQTRKYMRESPPTFSDRVLQWTFGMVLTLILCHVMALGVLTALGRQGIDLAQLTTTFPGWLVAAEYAIPLLAITLAVYVSVRGVYLAQLVGLAVGVCGAAVFLAERALLPELAPHWHEWLVLPLLGAAVGFLCGLLITGQLQVVRQEVEYKPMETWDRDAKPRYHEIGPSINTRWTHIVLGILTALLFGPIVRFTLGILFSRLYSSGPFEVMLASFELPIEALGLLAGGVVAGAGTKSGILQGLLAGIGIYLVRFFVFGIPAANDVELGVRLLQYLPIPVCIVGGLIGRKIFGPVRVYTSPDDGT